MAETCIDFRDKLKETTYKISMKWGQVVDIFFKITKYFCGVSFQTF